jgi:hypothetical protein
LSINSATVPEHQKQKARSAFAWRERASIPIRFSWYLLRAPQAEIKSAQTQHRQPPLLRAQGNVSA